MNKLYTTLGFCILSLSITLNSWAANPCQPIAKVCKQQGYYKGGNKEGKGLIENCLMPVVSKQKTLPNTNFSDDTLANCKTSLTEKMKSQGMR